MFSYPLSHSITFTKQARVSGDDAASTSAVDQYDSHVDQQENLSDLSDVSEMDVDSGVAFTVESRRSAHGAHMASISRRIDSFSKENWERRLVRSNLTNPLAMAQVGWYCTGPRSARCYACNKEMDEWAPSDNPREIHETRSADCPLNIHRPAPPTEMTWREQIRLDTAIAFYHKRMEKRTEALKVEQAFQNTRDSLQRKLTALNSVTKTL